MIDFLNMLNSLLYLMLKAGEADDDVLLKLADQQLNKGNSQGAKLSIGQVEARLDQDFHVIRTSNKTGHIENMMEEYSKRIGIQYKMCSLLLMKVCNVYFSIKCQTNITVYSMKQYSYDGQSCKLLCVFRR